MVHKQLCLSDYLFLVELFSILITTTVGTLNELDDKIIF